MRTLVAVSPTASPKASAMHKLVLLLVIGDVTLRFFTNYLEVIPRIFNIAEQFMVALLAVMFLLGARESRPPGKQWQRMAWYWVLFNLIAIVGTLLNLHYIYPLAAISQLILWNAPIVLFLIVMRIPLAISDVERYMGVLVKLLKLELIWGFAQIYNYLQTGRAEEIKGTFYHNAEQYQAFVLIGVFYLIGRLESKENPRRQRHRLGVLVILSLVLLIDNKASWLALAATLFYILMKMPAASAELKTKLKYACAFAAMAAFGYLIITMTSTSLGKYSRLSEAWHTGNLLNIGKVRAFGDVASAYGIYPHMIIFGSGLGTFYSASAYQFMPPKITEMYTQAPLPTQRDAVYSESNSMGGVITPVTDMEPFYRQFYRERKIFPIFSGTADDPTSSYVSLLGETGVIASLLYVSFYWSTLKRLKALLPILAKDQRMFPFLVATIGFFVYLMLLGTYNFWLENGRLATILWSMAAMILKYGELKKNEPLTASAAPHEILAPPLKTPPWKMRQASMIRS
jgi:hypothetical protein